MTKIVFTREAYDTLAEAVRGVPAEKPLALNANLLRAILREIRRDHLEPEDDDAPPDDPPVTVQEDPDE